LVPENTSYHVADIEKRSSEESHNNGSTTTRQERKNDIVASTVAYNKINNTTLENITNNGSTTTKVDENSENISVVVIIEVVFAILACFAIILGLIIFVSNVMKKQWFSHSRCK